jgi:hypothetical protein
MTISNVYLIFWGPFKFGGPVRSHGPHVLRYGPATSHLSEPKPETWEFLPLSIVCNPYYKLEQEYTRSGITRRTARCPNQYRFLCLSCYHPGQTRYPVEIYLPVIVTPTVMNR